MFINQSTIFLSFLALLRVVVAQSTPWCLLSAIGTQPDPADLGAICGTDSSNVVSIIKSTCADGDSQAALSAYSSKCSAAGQFSTSSTSPSGTPSSGFVTSTPGAGPSPTPASTGSGSNSGSGAFSGPGSKSGSGPVPKTSPPTPLSTGGAVSSIDAGSAAAFAAALFVGLVAML